MTFIAPAGTRLSALDLAAGLGAGLLSHRTPQRLQDLLAQHAGHSLCWPMASGRAAMTLMLSAAKVAAPSRTEVIVAGYTCYSVAASIERAGLKLRLCDIDPQTLGMDPEQLRRMDFSRVLAVISANLYGFPNALNDIEAIAAERGVFMIDDAAQSLGAKLGTRSVGGFGNAGLYSFDKGKNITTLQGGAIVARAGQLANAITNEYAKLAAASTVDAALYAVKLAAYGLLLRPSLYGIVQKIPGLGLGRTEYETRYPITRLSPMLSGLALRLGLRLDSINAVRIENAARLSAALADAKGVQLAKVAADAHPVFVRYPLLVQHPERRAALLAALNRDGIGATASYPHALADVPEIGRVMAQTDNSQAGAKHVARSIVTLPTHAYCPPDMAQRIRAIVDRTLA